MKKYLAIVLAVVLMLVGCQSATPASSDQASETQGSETAANTEDMPKITLKIGHVQNEDNPLHLGMLHMAERVAERTNGNFVIEVYFNSQLGDTADVVEQEKTGSNVGANTDAGIFSNEVPEIGIIDAPYLFDNYDEIDRFTQSEMFGAWTTQLEDHGYKVLCFNWYEGPRHLLTKNEVKSIADIKDQKLRTTGSPVWQATVNAMGAKATPLAWGEIYSGIQQKVVDGCEAQSVGIYGSKLYEVTNYMTKTNHFQLIGGIVVGKEWFDKLPAEYQQILIEESIAAGRYSSELCIEEIALREEEMKQTGLVINEIDLAPFKEATDKVYDQFDGYRELKTQIYEVLDK